MQNDHNILIESRNILLHETDANTVELGYNVIKGT
jgi:hypothetical protein